MSKMNVRYRDAGPGAIILSVVLSVLFIVTAVQASTTIGTDITTGGAITVTGAVAASSTLQVTGAVTTYSTLASGGNLTIPAASSLDTATAGVLNIGNVTASAITIGKSGATTTFPGGVVLTDTTTNIVGAVDSTKKLNISVVGNTTGVTGTLASVFTTAKTLTLPDATDTLVGKATTDTLTNKTLTSPILTSPILTTPNIGAAIGTSLAVAGAITSSSTSAGIGYAAGAGLSVIQGAGRTTGVTINAVTGKIQTDTASLAASSTATFTVTNSSVAIGDVVVVSQRSGAVNVKTIVNVTAVAAGSFNITIYNADTVTAETGAIIINFAIIKAVSA
jgi:hypothetical protein